jgi:hypothetical protein
VETLIQTEQLPTEGRFGFWHDQFSRIVAPPQIATIDLAGLQADRHLARFGAIQVSSLIVLPGGPHRTPQLTPQPDPDTFQLVIARHGRTILTQDSREARPEPTDLVLLDNTRPHHIQTIADEDTACGIQVVFRAYCYRYPHS